jgi:HlyD family secretion protein
MRIRPQRILLVLVALGVVGAIVYGFLPQPVPADVGRVVRGDLRISVDEEGRTRIKERYVVSTPLAGNLSRIVLEAGQPVQAGKTLIAIVEPTDPTLLDDRALAESEARVKAAEATRERTRAVLERARQEHEFAQVELERQKNLLRTKTIATQVYDAAAYKERMAQQDVRAAEFAVQIAEFELEQARAALVHTRRPAQSAPSPARFEIRAPVDGRVLRVIQESATVVSPGTPLVEVGDPNDLEVLVDVLSRDAVRIHPGDRVLLERWGGDEPLHGRVRLVEPSGFTKVSALGVEEQRVNVLIDFSDPPAKRAGLGDGFRVEARIVVWEKPAVLEVPAGALFRDGDGWAVFRVEDGRARRRRVVTGRSNGLQTQVLDGLAEGDEVVVHPGDRVADGVRIEPR